MKSPNMPEVEKALRTLQQEGLLVWVAGEGGLFTADLNLMIDRKTWNPPSAPELVVDFAVGDQRTTSFRPVTEDYFNSVAREASILLDVDGQWIEMKPSQEQR